MVEMGWLAERTLVLGVGGGCLEMHGRRVWMLALNNNMISSGIVMIRIVSLVVVGIVDISTVQMSIALKRPWAMATIGGKILAISMLHWGT